jgi:acyl carrier protein
VARSERLAPDLDEQLFALLRARAPLAQGRSDLPDDLRLGAGGLGLDSIALVELLLECEERFGLPRSTGLLESDEPLTVGRLLAHCRAVAGR